MSCKCRLHVETRWSPTRTWHAVLRRSSKDTTIAIVPSFADTPRAFTASFNVIPRFFKRCTCAVRTAVAVLKATKQVRAWMHVAQGPAWLQARSGLIQDLLEPNGHIPKELPTSLHGVGSLRRKLVEIPMCHQHVDQSCSEFSEDLGVNGLVCNDGEVVATFLEDTVLLAMT